MANVCGRGVARVCGRGVARSTRPDGSETALQYQAICGESEADPATITESPAISKFLAGLVLNFRG